MSARGGVQDVHGAERIELGAGRLGSLTVQGRARAASGEPSSGTRIVLSTVVTSSDRGGGAGLVTLRLRRPD